MSNVPKDVPKELLDFIKKAHLSVRAQKVVDYLIDNGSVTTEEIASWGYGHAPRAIRDVREAGIPLITSRIQSSDGRSIGIYTFGEPKNIKENRLEGRTTFPKYFKDELYKLQDGRCEICSQKYDKKFLQVDHRVPYEFGEGDSTELETADFMLLCAEDNRRKARATEVDCAKTCFQSGDINIVKSCFWASPENYTHIAMKPIRQLELAWFGKDETDVFDQAKSLASAAGMSLQDYLKSLLSEQI